MPSRAAATQKLSIPCSRSKPARRSPRPAAGSGSVEVGSYSEWKDSDHRPFTIDLALRIEYRTSRNRRAGRPTAPPVQGAGCLSPRQSGERAMLIVGRAMVMPHNVVTPRPPFSARSRSQCVRELLNGHRVGDGCKHTGIPVAPRRRGGLNGKAEISETRTH
jgi:hypothetical protein